MEDKLDENSEIYIAFGDDSVTPEGTFYGFILVPERYVDATLHQIEAIKILYGGSPQASLHSWRLFHLNERKKTEWSHLSEQDTLKLCAEILNLTQRVSAKFLLAHIPAQYYPKRFRLIGKNGYADLVHDIDEKWLTLWAYFRVAFLFDPDEILIPKDPALEVRPRNLPFWQPLFKRDAHGFRVRKVFLDRAKHKIRWFSKSFQWETIAKELVIESPRGRTHLPVVTSNDQKHPLLDVADIFTYANARILSGRKELVFPNFNAEVDVIQIIGDGDEIIFGDGPV